MGKKPKDLKLYLRNKARV